MTSEKGVVLTDSSDGTKAVSQVAEDLEGQIVVRIEDPSISYVDFQYTLPGGYLLQSAADGGFNLVDAHGEIQGSIRAAWARDAVGQVLDTRYEVLPGNVIRQHVHTRGYFPCCC
ncbi:MAG: hypothetical protein ACK5LN_11940 [Propioniciclava sp.]